MPVLYGPERVKCVSILSPATDAAGRTGIYVNLTNAGSALVRVHVTQGNAATIALTLKQATANDGTGVKNLANVVPIYANLDVAASDTDVRATDAVSYTTDAGVKIKIITFLVRPSDLDINNGFKFLTIATGASNAGNLTSAVVELFDPRYTGSAPPTALS